MDENNVRDNAVAPAGEVRHNWRDRLRVGLGLIPPALLLGLLCSKISPGLAAVMPWVLAIPISILLSIGVIVLWNVAWGCGNSAIEVGVTSTLLIVLILVLSPVFQKVRAHNLQKRCSSNLAHIAEAMRLYANDHEGVLPVSEGWQTAITPYLGRDKEGKQIGAEVFRCPALSNTSKAPYGFAPQLAGQKLDSLRHLDTLPLVYDSADGSVPVYPGRHQGGNNIAYADAHVKWKSDTKNAEEQKVTPQKQGKADSSRNTPVVP